LSVFTGFEGELVYVAGEWIEEIFGTEGPNKLKDLLWGDVRF